MTAKENDQSHGEDGDVIDAEIISDQTSEVGRDAPQPARAAQQQSGSGKAGWWVAFILLVFIGGLLAAPYVRDGLLEAGLLAPVQSTASAQARALPQEVERSVTALQTYTSDNSQTLARQQEMIAQLMERLDNIEALQQKTTQDIGLIAGDNTAVRPDGAQIAALQAEVARLTAETARLTALAGTQSPDVASINGQIALARAENDQLRQQVQALKAAIAGLQEGALGTTPRGRLLIVLGRIKDQAQAGLAFGAELNSAQLDIATLPAIDQQLVGADFSTLAQHADGVASFQALSREYGDTARAIKLAQEKADGGFLANLFTVRRTDDGATGIDAVLLEAERRLQVRDVAGAVNALASLEGEARVAATSWLDKAEAHTATMTAIDRLLRTIAGRGLDAPRGGLE